VYLVDSTEDILIHNGICVFTFIYTNRFQSIFQFMKFYFISHCLFHELCLNFLIDLIVLSEALSFTIKALLSVYSELTITSKFVKSFKDFSIFTANSFFHFFGKSRMHIKFIRFTTFLFSSSPHENL
jgi:hypothetical protein